MKQSKGKGLARKVYEDNYPPVGTNSKTANAVYSFGSGPKPKYGMGMDMRKTKRARYGMGGKKKGRKGRRPRMRF